MTTDPRSLTPDPSTTIQSLLNRPYDSPHDRPCWAFARDVLALMGHDLSESPRTGLIRVAYAQIGGLVLFAAGFDWHCGVIWPDGLHFIHAMPPDAERRPNYFEVRQAQLQAEPWRQITEGFYVPNKQEVQP